VGIPSRSQSRGVPLHAIVGRNELPADAAQRIAQCWVIEATTLSEIAEAATQLGREIVD
jgi:hypothetical protein